MKKQPNRIGDRRVVELSYETLAWLLGRLRDLAPAGVASRMESKGIVEAKDEHAGRATWTNYSARDDVHANMGAAVEDIVAELRADSLLMRAVRRLLESIDTDGHHYEAQSPVEDCAISALEAVVRDEALAEAYLDALDASDTDDDDGWWVRKEGLRFIERFEQADAERIAAAADGDDDGEPEEVTRAQTGENRSEESEAAKDDEFAERRAELRERDEPCSCDEPKRVTCDGCERAWCERCDPAAVGWGCHYCHGRGYTTGALPPELLTADAALDSKAQVSSKELDAHQSVAAAVKMIRLHGPSRVVINDEGEAVRSKRAREEFEIVPEVVFIRNDGWSLGAPASLVEVAMGLWRDSWVAVLVKPDEEPVPFDEYLASRVKS